MIVKARHHRIKEYECTWEEMKELFPNLRGATLAETMGPNWKDLYWSPNHRCYVLNK